jgi:putative transposase
MTFDPVSFPRHRFPAAFISHAVWLYHVSRLGLRNVEPILVERGVVVTHRCVTTQQPGTHRGVSALAEPVRSR